jgi:hypothetical protein
MHRTRNFIPILALLLMTACIKPYSPFIESSSANKLVVSGKITNIGGWQKINISRSSQVNEPEFIPLPGCTVKVLDDKGNIFPFPEYDPGSYQAWFGNESLMPGTAYKLSVITPEGEMIESSYDTLMPGAALDSVYYILENVPTGNPDIYLRGLQFYVDLNATESDSRYYKWEVLETWEFHAAHPAENYYDGRFHEVIPPDYSKMVCYNTSLVKNIYTLSTKSLALNVYHKFPLQFVDGQTPRLGILYSTLVTQLALSETAYNYWEEMRYNSTGLGGLYEQQPYAIKGNLVNLTNPDKDVLGYFYVASASSKRYFYKDIEGLELDFYNNCIEDNLPISGWAGFPKNSYPVYYYFNEADELKILSDGCIDCRLNGGTLTKPDFWPN